MANEVKQPAMRRGIANAAGAARKKFSHQDAKPNGLFLGHIEEVSVRDVDFSESAQGSPSFAGMSVPRLDIVFASNEENPTARKYYTHSFLAVESNVETAFNGKNAWQVDAILNWLNHIIEVFYCKGEPIETKLTGEQQDKLTLPFNDYDYDKKEYVIVDVETVLDGWRQLFLNFQEFVNTANDGAPIYKNKDGKKTAIWMRLVRYVKTGKGKNKKWNEVNNGELGFPRFVQEGNIELFKAGVGPAMRTNPIIERIEPMQLEEAKTPTKMPGAGTTPIDNFGNTDTPFPDNLPSYDEPF